MGTWIERIKICYGDLLFYHSAVIQITGKKDAAGDIGRIDRDRPFSEGTKTRRWNANYIANETTKLSKRPTLALPERRNQVN